MKKIRFFPLSIISLFLVVALLFPSALSAMALDETQNFAEKAAQFIEENSPDSVFSEIVMKLNSSAMFVSGQETYSTPPKNVNGKIYISATALAKQTGKKYISTFGAGDYAPLDRIADDLNLSVNVTEDTIIITSPYQLCQLIIETKDTEPLHDMYGAKDYITDGAGQYLISYNDEDATKAARAAFDRDPNVIFCNPNKVIQGNVKVDPADIYMMSLTDEWGSERVSSALMKRVIKDKPKVTVAVIDTGIDETHPVFKNRLVTGVNFVKYGKPPIDDNDHGTHVSGTVVQNTPENVQIMPLKVLDADGFGSDYLCKLGIDYALQNDAKVVNLSFGGYCEEKNCILSKAVKNAVSKGVTVIVSAGNDETDTANFCPANVSQAITVTASDIFDELASFSNFGAAVDICAPGYDIYSAIRGGEYGWMSGTSMASPHISAAAAMIKMNEPNLTPAQIESKITASAQDAGTKGKDKYFGHGILNLALYLNVSVYPQMVRISESYINYVMDSPSSEKHPISFHIGPLNITDKSLNIAISDPGVATYTTGFISLFGYGDAKATVTTGGSVRTECDISVFSSSEKKLHSFVFPIDRSNGIIYSIEAWSPIGYLTDCFTYPVENIHVYKNGQRVNDPDEYASTGMEFRLVIGGVVCDTVTMAVIGDVDKNGVCNLGDIVALRNIIMAGNLTPLDFYSCDFDNDKKINLADIVSLRSLVMSGQHICNT